MLDANVVAADDVDANDDDGLLPIYIYLILIFDWTVLFESAKIFSMIVKTSI